MTNFYATRLLLTFSVLLLSVSAFAKDCDCKVERIKNQTVFSRGCDVPEEICSLEVGSGVNQVDLRRFTDLRGIHVKLGNNIQPTFLGSAASDKFTKFIAKNGVNLRIDDNVGGRDLNYQSGAGNNPNGIKAYNKNLNKCGGNCTLIAPAEQAESPAMLPITLRFWDATAVQRGAELLWETEREIDNDYFVVYRSTDGVTFTEITRLTGHGTTDATTTYRFVDAGAASSEVYYRLEQVDFDGTRHVLGLRQVTFAAAQTASAATVSPNPATAGGNVRVNVNQPAGTPVRVVDLAGRPVSSSVLSYDGSFQLPGDLQAGLYVIIVREQATRLVVRP